jgi:DNA-binding CsgD family transcriptional regulator
LRYAETLPPRELADLLRRRSVECYLTDEADEAIDALRRAAACYRAIGDRLKEGETIARLANILWCPGRGEEARRTAREAVELLEQLPPGPELAIAYATLSFALATACEGEAAWKAACQAVELADSLGDPDARCFALCELGWRELARDPAAGLAKVEQAAALARERAHVDLVGGLYLCRAIAAVRTGRDDLAEIAFEEGLAYAQKEGDELRVLYLLANRACLELDQGRWGDAVEFAELVVGRPWLSTMPRTLALTVIARIRARRGDPNVAPLIAEAQALAEPTGELPRIAPVAIAAAEVAWLSGSSATAVRDATEQALALAVQVGAGETIVRLQAWRKRAGTEEPPHPSAAAAPNRPEHVADLDAATPAWTDVGPPYPPRPAAAAEADRLELVGDFDAAAAIWMQAGRPYEAALALADTESEAGLRRSLQLLTELGARATMSITTRRLRSLGARDIPRGKRPTTRRNPAELTTRELEILQLLDEGLPNATIAERLYLSPRTIENHVSAILRKLNARSRSEAVTNARRQGAFAAAENHPGQGTAGFASN